MMNLCHLPPVKQAQPSFPQPLSLHLPEEVVESIIPVEHSQPRQMSEPASQPVSQEFKLSTRSSQQQRRRRSAAGFDVRSRLFQVEEERAETEILQNRELADDSCKSDDSSTSMEEPEPGPSSNSISNIEGVMELDLTDND
ncbi:hypothetical protein ACJJTC_002407 [Scirpophaga incertulas]